MKAFTGTIYEAFDGQRFITENECSVYETELKLLREGNELKDRYEDLMADIRHYCNKMLDEEYDDYEGYNKCTNTTCPFYDENCCQSCSFDRIPCND